MRAESGVGPESIGLLALMAHFPGQRFMADTMPG